MKNILILLTFILLPTIFNELNAQIFSTKSEIIKLKGTDYKIGYTDSGNEYILYTKFGETKRGETYIYAEQFIFVEIEGTDQPVCIIKKIYEQEKRINEIIDIMKKNYVQLSYLKFKDYASSFIYDIEIKDTDEGEKLCVITIYHDSEE
jgi:hypothetical protein